MTMCSQVQLCQSDKSLYIGMILNILHLHMSKVPVINEIVTAVLPDQ